MEFVVELYVGNKQSYSSSLFFVKLLRFLVKCLLQATYQDYFKNLWNREFRKKLKNKKTTAVVKVRVNSKSVEVIIAKN